MIHPRFGSYSRRDLGLKPARLGPIAYAEFYIENL